MKALQQGRTATKQKTRKDGQEGGERALSIPPTLKPTRHSSKISGLACPKADMGGKSIERVSTREEGVWVGDLGTRISDKTLQKRNGREERKSGAGKR